MFHQWLILMNGFPLTAMSHLQLILFKCLHTSSIVTASSQYLCPPQTVPDYFCTSWLQILCCALENIQKSSSSIHYAQLELKTEWHFNYSSWQFLMYKTHNHYMQYSLLNGQIMERHPVTCCEVVLIPTSIDCKTQMHPPGICMTLYPNSSIACSMNPIKWQW